MKKLVSIFCFVLACALTMKAYAGDGHNHGKEKHCEKKVDGKTVHLDHIKNRKACKQEGGRWVKHKKKKDDHDHGSHNDHKDHKDHKDGDHKDHKGHGDHKEGDGHKH